MKPLNKKNIDFQIDNSNHKKIEQGFSVPKNYFSNLENRVFKLENLKNLRTNSAFKVPENYFDSFESIIISKTVSKPKIISIAKKKKTILLRYAVVASIALLISLFFNKVNNSKNDTNLQTISVLEIKNWYENEHGIISNNELAEIINPEDFEITDTDLISIENTYLNEYFDSFFFDKFIEENIITQ